MKTGSKRALGLKIAICGAVLAAIALTALRMPRSALTVIQDAESASACTVLRDGVTNETAYPTPDQLGGLRAALAETTLHWSGRRPDAIQFWRDKPLYRVIFDSNLDGFEMVGSRAYCDGWSYRMSEKDAQRLSTLLDSFFEDAS